MLNKAVVDLRKLKDNALSVKRLLPPNVKFCAVVKADGYGHGAEVVSSSLYPLADAFAVALVEEGVSLRLSGIDKPILVLGKSFEKDAEIAVRYDLTLTATSVLDARTFNAVGKRYGKRVDFHIKFNSGMNRLGVNTLSEVGEILDFASKNGFIAVKGVFSHYACPEREEERKNATEKFSKAAALCKSYDKKIISHISASGGFICGEYFDMVRIGILLYGYKPFETDVISVKPIMKIYAPVIERRSLKKGEGAFYGLQTAEKDLDFSIIRYGYADGLDRTSGRKDETESQFRQFSNRCMDMTAICGVPKPRAYYPALYDADILAKEYNTINYEILTKSTARVEKIYIN